MKSAKWMLPVTLMLLSSLMAAQSLSSSHVVAQVPFDFMVNNKIIPAGECIVQAVDLDARVVTIRNVAAKKSLLARSSHEEANKSDSTVLVFNRYGNRYFLSEIRLEGSAETYKLSESRVETELRAQNAPASQKTLLASLK
jgi:hypothetical protein